jgi:DNA-binding MarR family transcriptional regulator
MSNAKRDARLIELVAAFTEMGPAWIRWVEAAIPDESVSFVRLRMLNALERHPEGLTMTQLSAALDVTARRVTALVDALSEDGLVERYAHPTDRRSVIVELTDAGLALQRKVWEGHQARVAVAFGDLSDDDQVRLLDISRKVTTAFRQHLTELAVPPSEVAADPHPDAMLIRNNRRVRPARPNAT